MSLYDLQQRVQLIYDKYEKYQQAVPRACKARPSRKNAAQAPHDAWTAEYQSAEEELERLHELALADPGGKAANAHRNAQLRRSKNYLLSTAVPLLERKIRRGTGVTDEVVEERRAQVNDLVQRIYAVPDSQGNRGGPGMYAGVNQLTSGAAPMPSIVIEMSDTGGRYNPYSSPGYFSHTKDTQQFDEEWQAAQERQDRALDRIDANVTALGQLAHEMGDTLKAHDALITDIDRGLDRANVQVKTNNQKLAGVLRSVRSSRKLWCDMFLVCTILGIIGYLVALVSKNA